MARAGSLQTSFLGGIFSPYAQGRADIPQYKTALNECLNSYPIEEGAWIRRPGSALGGVTFNNVPARIFAFDITGSAPIQMEVTAGAQNGRVRFWFGTTLCYDYTSTVTNIGAGSPYATITIASNPIDPYWGTGPNFAFIASSLNYPTDQTNAAFPWQEVQLVPQDNYTKKRLGAYLNKRTFVLQGIDGNSTSFTMLDQFYNAISNSDPLVTLWNGSCNVQIQRVSTLLSPYTNQQYQDVRFVMCEMQGYFLHGGVSPVRIRAIPLNTTPLALNNLPSAPNACQFVLDQPQFIDGPYLDPPTNRNASGCTVLPLTGFASVPGFASIGLFSVGGAFPGLEALAATWVPLGGQVLLQVNSWANEFINGLNTTKPSASGEGFVSTDVGRLVRWFNQPPTYSNYAIYSSAPGAGGYVTQGAQVTYPESGGGSDGSYFLAIGQGIFGIPIDIVGKSPIDFTPAQIASYRNLATLAASGNSGSEAFFDAILLDQPFWAALPDFFAAWMNWGVILGVLDSKNVIVGQCYGSPDPSQLIFPPTPFLGELIGVTPTGLGSTPLSYQVGVYSQTTGYPRCGAWHEGRLWLGGGVPNFFCASVPDGIHGTLVNGVQIPPNADTNLIFSPTDLRGTINDSNGMAEFINSVNSNSILWMVPAKDGLVMGTSSGEWHIQASNQNNVLTPTSIQAHRVTKYGCADIEPRLTGLTTVFVQKEGRRMHEFLQDVFSQRFYGPNLTEYARNLTYSGVKDIAYQEEMTPILWAVLNNGTLLGCTYRRVAMFSSEPPKFFGWHRHLHGCFNRTYQYISAGSSPNGLGQALSMITVGPGGA